MSGSRDGRSSRISVTDSSGGIPLADLIASTPGPHSSSACAGGNAALGENTPLARRRPRSTGAAGSPTPGITNDDVLIDGSKVAIRFHGEGDNTGTPATGRHARVTGIRIFTVAGDRFTETWANYDQLGLYQQLGLIGALPGQSAVTPSPTRYVR